MKYFKKQKGITLVALVITVIVMLILAGVAISAITDGEGLFNKTQNAAERYEQAAQDEADQMQEWIDELDNYLAGLPVEDNPVVKDKAEIGIVVDDNQTFDGRLKGTYDNPIIPKGFSPEDENDATWGTENGWQKGLVIKDESGNEFVWVPVDGTTIKFERQDWRNGEGKLLTYPENTTVGTDIDTQYTENIPIEITESVTKNGGFYIARYEAGIAEKMPQEDLLSDSTSAYGNGTYRPVSKQGAIVWNWIQWGTNNDEINPGNGAVTVARSMYLEEDTNYGAVSTLIYGVQWDTALKFIEVYSGDADYLINSDGKGNYKGTSGGDDIASISAPAVCGARDDFRKNNIYDMAGNVWEWTMEQYSYDRVDRSGGYLGSGLDVPACSRFNNNLDISLPNGGFRVALYIK